MTQATINQLASLLELLAMPMVYLALLGLVFFFIVKPLFAYLFDPKRVSVQHAVEKKQQSNIALQKLNEIVDGDDLIVDPEQDIPNILTDEERIAKLSASDPERAGQLVKQWLHVEPEEESSKEK